MIGGREASDEVPENLKLFDRSTCSIAHKVDRISPVELGVHEERQAAEVLWRLNRVVRVDHRVKEKKFLGGGMGLRE